ncbi:MAG: 30S ribosome-binding factor RbfA [Bacilli bacterium]|nr:30S ribosome-binding factor RbfA [Bacilli bacterium]
MSLKIDRLNNMFVEEISKIIHTEIKDNGVSFVTITDVRITNDLSFAKIYFTTLDNDREKVLKSLNKARGFIRTSLCDRVKIRKMPEIQFVYDESIEYGKKIEDIIERINNEK